MSNKVIRKKGERPKRRGERGMLHVRLSPDALWQLREIAAVRGVSVNVLVSDAVDRQVRRLVREAVEADAPTPESDEAAWLRHESGRSADRLRRERAMGVPRG